MVDSRTAPAVGTSDRRHAAQRHAAIDGAGWRHDGRDRLSVPRPRPAGHRSSRGAGAPSRTRSVARPRAWPSDTLTGGRVRRLARPAAPTTAAASPGRSPRPPSSGTGSAPPPPARGRRRMADAPSTPSRCGKRGQQVRGGGWSAVPAVPGPARGTSSAAAASASRGEPGAGRPRRVALAELPGAGGHTAARHRRLEMCSASKSAISETSQPLALCLAASWGVAPAAPGAHRRPRHTAPSGPRCQAGSPP